MRFEHIDLFPDAEKTYLKAYLCDDMPNFNNRRKAILILPGGGYSGVCDDREGDAVARGFLAAGINTFVLKYSVKPYANDFRPQIQALTAIKYIRENAEHFSIDPDYVFTVGFSAGGHLAGSTGVFWKHPKIAEALGDISNGICRPTGMILSYPVITSGKFANRGSFLNLCGKDDATAAEMAEYSLENFVDSETPPAFLWHTFADTGVPVENSLLMASALRENGVPFELHIYPEGWHGMSLATPEVSGGDDTKTHEHNRTWFPLVLQWIETVKPTKHYD